MTRISETQLQGQLLLGITRNRNQVAKFSNEISTGLKVQNPGDSNLSGTISSFRESLTKIEGYKDRVANVRSLLVFQDDIMAEMNDLLTRAKEIATQAANETNSTTSRDQMAAEVFQIRDHIAQLANSTYQGRYIYGGTDDDDPPFDPATYVNPGTGPESVRYVHDAEAGTGTTKTVNITDDLTIDVVTPGSQLFLNALNALERLGRAMKGYETLPATGVPDGTGAAYTFPADYGTQTTAIQNSIDLLDQARENDIIPERTALGGKMRRLDTADSLLELGRVNAEELLAKLQNADIIESASSLTQAETALQASFAVTTRVLNLSILDFI
ncbi:MAG: hypothetical protein J5J00_03170 [Deltaproteobacteria bacterium]|nr:hypothetical protein [Deltaproteobacteria bacterium]